MGRYLPNKARQTQTTLEKGHRMYGGGGGTFTIIVLDNPRVQSLTFPSVRLFVSNKALNMVEAVMEDLCTEE